jgi:site-specific recombinase XerD
LREWLKKVGLPYHSPHKFRHGFAVYTIKLANDMADLKAISMNLMHSNISITDGIYGGFSTNDVEKRITTLGKQLDNSGLSKEQLIRKLEMIISELSK